MKYINKFSFKNGNQNRYVLFLVESDRELNNKEKEELEWILNPNPKDLKKPELENSEFWQYVGPNLRFETPESSKLRAICESIGLKHILRIEKFTGYATPGLASASYDKMTEAVFNDIPKTLIVSAEPEPTYIVPLSIGGLSYFEKVSTEMGLGMDNFDREYYFDLFTRKYKRDPTDVELAQLAQANSSHSRHWEFSGKFIINGEEMPKTLFDMVKETLAKNPTGNVKAFKDNGGILKGGLMHLFFPNVDGVYKCIEMPMNHTATAETHNHPTLISPYPGAATGVGGRMRDISAIGRGSLIGFGGLYFQTGRLWLNEDVLWDYPENMAKPIDVLTGAIRGASDWGNPFGEPTLLFGNDSLGFIVSNGDRFESVKPNIYTCAVGSIPANAEDKAEARPGLIIIRIGGPTWRIGVGGGAASSMGAGENKSELDFKSVQRGNPLMGRAAYNVIEHCIYLGKENPIEAIHDQGAGGASNVLTELMDRCGGLIDMGKIQIADPSLSKVDVWIAEAQEIYGLLVSPENVERLEKICEKYGCPIEILGKTNNSNTIVVQDSRDGSTPVTMTLPEILGKLPQKTYCDQTVPMVFDRPNVPALLIRQHLKNVARVPGVAFLSYMVDHFDGSVGGKVVQGPRVGEYQLPIHTHAICSAGFKGVTGAIGNFTRSNPAAMLIDEKATARMLVAQMLMNVAFTTIGGGTKKLKGRLNVMWPFKKPGMKAKLYSAYTAVTKALEDAGIGIDGGKDSLSMMTKFGDSTAVSFPTFILEMYAHLADFRKRVTPDLKPIANTDLILIELEENKNRMGGSALLEAYDQTGDSVPDANVKKAAKLFTLIQYLVRTNKILAGSPKLKGGLLATVAKMSIASDVESHIGDFLTLNEESFYFNEEIGVVIQCKKEDTEEIIARAKKSGFVPTKIGWVKHASQYFTYYSGDKKNSFYSHDVRGWFSETGKAIKERLGVPKEVLRNELYSKQKYSLTFDPDERTSKGNNERYSVGVLAAPGTNGHHELAYMFGRMNKKFKVQIIHMDELIKGKRDLKEFYILAFAGGFSYGDVGGSGTGWAATINFNPKLKAMFDEFFQDPRTLSFGVCNGFQVATLLGVLDESLGQKPRLTHNNSGIFEHRPVNLLIPENTTSVMFKGMQGSILPAWSAHGEGRLFLPDGDYSRIIKLGLVPVQYVDAIGSPTIQYPRNPNGSSFGIAGLCTKDGRHTFMMPHIERVSASNNHLPYRPKDWKFKNPVWQKAIENMYQWLVEMDSLKNQSVKV